MPLASGSYVPALRWRLAEYQALLRLDDDVKDRIVPLITIPPIEFDFETQTLSRTVHEHVHPFVDRYRQKWGQRPSWVTLDDSIANGRMESGEHVLDYVLDGLRAQRALAIPALSLSAASETRRAVAQAMSFDRHGLGVLLRIEDLMRDDAGATIRHLAAEVGGSLDEIDVLIDLGGPNYEPYPAFAEALVPALRHLGKADTFRNLVLIGTAIPESFGSLVKGSDELPRHDWLFYQVLLEHFPEDMRTPTYGDHTIVHPSFKAIDFRAIRPAGKILYTTGSTWGTRKGGAFQNDRDQMHAHCSAIVAETSFDFRGADYSDGDDYIARCAARAAGPSTLTRWKEVGINHHITTVVDDLAKLDAASSTS